MTGRLRAGVHLALALALALMQVTPAYAVPLTRSDYEACQAQDDAAFRDAVTAITAKALRQETETIDYQSIVAIEWRRQELDALIDARVDEAVTAVREETSWGSLLQSLASQEQAQKLATAVSERVYRSEDMAKAIEKLAAGVGSDVGGRIELAGQQAAGPALECLKAFVGPRYGTMVSTAVTLNAGSDLDISQNANAEIGSGTVIKNSASGITGITLLIVRRQMANMARRIGQRIAGSILSRLVSVVAGGVGVVLIAKDVWDLRHGVLPIIADEMKSKSTKDKVRAELARSISTHINDHLDVISRATADQIVAIWHTFRRAHTQALDLADENQSFRTFLDGLPATRLARLDEVISITMEREGKDGVVKRLNNGTLETAVERLPDEAMTIARETRSIDDAIRWQSIAGDQLASVVRLALHQRARPEKFSQKSLSQLLALRDRVAVTRLAGLEPAARATLFELTPDELKRLARSLTESELQTLVSYLTGLKDSNQKRILAAVSDDPARILALKSAQVRDAVLASKDQQAAVELMLRDGSGSLSQIRDDFVMAWEGRIAPRLMVAKHPFVLAMAVLALALVLLLFARLVRPRGSRASGASTS